MKRLPWIKNNLPEPYIYFIIVEDNKERFLKIDFSYFPEMTYKSFESYGYKITEIQSIKFASKSIAIKTLRNITDSISKSLYTPIGQFPDPYLCYDPKLINLDSIQLDSITPEVKTIESQVCDMLQNRIKPSEIIEQLGVKDYYISRIKKKYGIS